MTKMTYVDALNYAIANLTDETVVEKLTALRDQQVKRNSADRKPTKAQVANIALQDKVMAVLTDKPMTVTEIMAQDAELSALSNQKVSALVNALVEAGRAVKAVEKRKSYFSRVA